MWLSALILLCSAAPIPFDVLPGLRGSVRALDLSADGRHLVTIDESNTATLWDLRTQRVLRSGPVPVKKETFYGIVRLRGETAADLMSTTKPWFYTIEGGSLRSSDLRSATNEYDGVVDSESGAPLNLLTTDRALYPCIQRNRVAVSNDRKRLLYACTEDRTKVRVLLVLEGATGAVIWRSEALDPFEGNDALFSADGDYVLYFREKLQRAKKAHIASKRVLELATPGLKSPRLSRSGKALWYTRGITAPRFGLTRIDVERWQVTLSVDSPMSWVQAANDDVVIGSTAAQSVYVFDPQSRRIVWTLPSGSGTIRSLGFADEAHLILDTTATRRVFELANARVARTYPRASSVYTPENEPDLRFTFDASSGRRAAGSSPVLPLDWSIQSTLDGRVLGRFVSPQEHFAEVSSGFAGKRLLITDFDSIKKQTTVRLLQTDTGKLLWSKQVAGDARGKLEPDERGLSLRVGSTTLYWRSDDGAQLSSFGDGDLFGAASLPRRLLTVSNDARRVVTLIDPAKNQVLGSRLFGEGISGIRANAIPRSSDVVLTLSDGSSRYTLERWSQDLKQKRWSAVVSSDVNGSLVVGSDQVGWFLTGETLPTGKQEVRYTVSLMSGRLSKADKARAFVPAPDASATLVQRGNELRLEQTGGASKKLPVSSTERCTGAWSPTWFAVGCGQTAYLFDKKTLALRLVLTSIDDHKLVARLPDGPYLASPAAIGAIQYREGEAVYDFESFDAYYNQPDAVLAALKLAPKERIAAYKQARLRRLEKLGMEANADPAARPKLSFTLSAGAAPLADGAQTDAESVTVSAKASSTQTNLAALVVRVNGVPLSAPALSLQPLSRSVERAIEVPLGHGRNFIAVSVVDSAGRESLRSEALVVRSGEASRTLYVLSLGVSRYAESDYDLEYAAKDATDLAAALQKHSAFSRVVTHTLLNEQVTRDGVLALKAKLAAATADDAVVIFYAGHGVLDDTFGYWLAAHDMRFSAPAERGLAYESLEALFDGVAARQRLLLIDACHSGEADPEDGLAAPPVLVSAGQGSLEVKTRGLKMKTRVADAQKQDTTRLMRELFLDTRPSNGSVVLTSAAGAERAIESGTLKNGLFTYALIEGLDDARADRDLDGGVSTSELLEHALERVRALSFGAQSPTARREARRFDFALTRSLR